MSWQRARRPEQKQEREDAILSAARSLAEQQGLEAITLAAIGERAGLSKANLYRYFESREDILLTVLLEDLRTWVDTLLASGNELAGCDNPASVAWLLAMTLDDRPLLAEGLSKVASVLERNLSFDRVLAVKAAMFEQMDRLAGWLQDALPSLPGDRIPELFRYVHVILTGIWPSAYPNDTVDRVLQQPEFAAARIDYVTELEGLLTVILHGMMTPG